MTQSSGVTCDSDCHVTLSAGTYERIHILTYEVGKNPVTAYSIRCHRAKCSCLGSQAAGICALLFPEHFNMSWLLFSFSHFGHQQCFSYYKVINGDTF
jgi:hypothetical protein